MNELNNFFLGVQQVAKDAVEKAPYDRTFRGVVTRVYGDGKCDVMINGMSYANVPVVTGLKSGHVVDVLFPQNNPSQMRITTQYDILKNGVNGMRLPEVQRGEYVIPQVQSQTTKEFSVSFDIDFTGAPQIVCGVVTDRPDLFFVSSPHVISKSNFKAHVRNNSNSDSDIKIRWVAVN